MKKKSYIFNFRLDKTTFDKLNTICEVEKINKSEFIRTIIDNFFMTNTKYRDEYFKNLNNKNG